MSRLNNHGYTYQCGRSSNYDQISDVSPTVHALGERIYQSVNLSRPSISGNSNMYDASHTAHNGALDPGRKDPRDFEIFHGQGLSLTLGTHFPSEHLLTSLHFEQAGRTENFVDRSYAFSRNLSRESYPPVCGSRTMEHEYSCKSASDDSAPLTSMVRCSRYLKPAQELLDEIVSISKGIDLKDDMHLTKESRICPSSQGEESTNYQKHSSLSGGMLFPEKGDIQEKIAKLNILLNELDSRYEHYRHRMEVLVSSFDSVAGLGAAKPYTILALHAMSRHFSTLRNAIIIQIRDTRRTFNGGFLKSGSGLANLSLVDQNSRQKRTAIHQLGNINIQQAWRPIRGLPETAVVILRAWLFEHFLHPYPNDAEKLMLASQTGLSRNQVTNWFINARVRLWKPMIEEMYRAEFEDSSMDSNLSTEDHLC